MIHFSLKHNKIHIVIKPLYFNSTFMTHVTYPKLAGEFQNTMFSCSNTNPHCSNANHSCGAVYEVTSALVKLFLAQAWEKDFR